MTEIQCFLADTVADWRPLYRAYALADGDMAVAGTPENNRRSTAAQAAHRRFATARRLHESGAAADPLEARRPAGAWLSEQFFRPGNTAGWNTHLTQATGEPLNPRHFVEALAG